MEQLAFEIRRLVYTVICFQCLLQFTAGSVYQRYLKLFSYFLTICMCCGVISLFVSRFEESMLSAQSIYDEWENEWQGLLDMERIRESSSYYTDQIWNEKILGSAYEQYDAVREGGEEDAKLVEE
ncbi:MAG: hypothetical protein HDR25_03855 [Lachnospiraceae bacterium]|nr:hypothetical protein [Lachnospiraceae bacterium]